MSKGDSEALDCPILDDGAFNQVLANRRVRDSEAGERVSHHCPSNARELIKLVEKRFRPLREDTSVRLSRRNGLGLGSGLLSHDPAASIAAAPALASSHSHLPVLSRRKSLLSVP